MWRAAGVLCVACIAMTSSCVGDQAASNDGADASLPVDASGADVQSSDAGLGGEAQADAASVCSLSKPFGSPELVDVHDTTQTAQILRFDPSGLVGYFSAVQAGGTYDAGVLAVTYDIFEAIRSSPTAAFAPATPVTSLNSAQSDNAATLTADGLTVYFVSTRGGGNDIYVASRSSAVADFGTPAPVENINTGVSEISPFVRADGNALYFSRNVGPHKLYRATIVGQAVSAPTELTELTSDDELFPAVTPDDLVIYYSSSRADGGAKGSGDVWVASRANASDPFSGPTNVGEVNSPDLEYVDFITADLCTLYFHRIALDDAGDQLTSALYVARRTP